MRIKNIGGGGTVGDCILYYRREKGRRKLMIAPRKVRFEAKKKKMRIWNFVHF